MKTGRRAQDLVHKAEKLGVKVYQVSDFWLEPHESSSSIVMAGFGGLSAAEIEEGISILRKAWLSSSKQER